MKTIKQIAMIASLVGAMWCALPLAGSAQMNKSYGNIDWQFTIPLDNHFANVASGWGMNFEGGCYVTPKFALGLFLNYHTNNEYIPRQTIVINEKSMVNTDQQHSLFELPFGVATRYKFWENSMVDMYGGIKLGAAYSEMQTYYNIFETNDNSWGFYMSPELGTTIYPMTNQNVGIHIALFYSFATNKGKVFGYEQTNLNNMGFRLGLAF